MSIIEIILIGIGLAMDAFAVSISKGLSLKNMDWSKALLCGLYFGGFQFLMPVIGYFLGYGFSNFVETYASWVAFVVLVAIGVTSIRGAQSEGQIEAESEHEGDSLDRLKNPDFGPKIMVPLAIATSIDALAVGVSFSFLKVNIWKASIIVGVVTFAIAIIGAKLGNIFGAKFKKTAEYLGGIILILIGFKILAEHLGIL